MFGVRLDLFSGLDQLVVPAVGQADGLDDVPLGLGLRWDDEVGPIGAEQQLAAAEFLDADAEGERDELPVILGLRLMQTGGICRDLGGCVPLEGPIQLAVDSQEPQDGDMWLDLGTIAAEFRTQVLPIYTPDDRVGPSGASSVALLIQPRQE